MEEKDFDLSVFRAAERLKREFDIRYDPENPIPCDDAMADRLFGAALEFYLEVGTFCMDTGRALKFSREEVEGTLAEAPDRIIKGGGADQHLLVHRQVEGSEEPVVCGGIQTILLSDDDFAFRFYRACAADPCVDGIWGGVVNKIEGEYDVIAGAPLEIYAYRRQIECMRRAVAAAGRPGMAIINNAPGSTATISMFDPQMGLRPTDHLISGSVSDMKVSYDDLDRVAYGLGSGIPVVAGHVAMLGGFSGSVEGAAIVAAASAFQSLMVNMGDYLMVAVTNMRVNSRGTRPGIWSEALALQALGRNTHLVLTGVHGDHPAAGPGTRQYFREAAAGFIAVVVSSGNQLAGTRKYSIGNTLNYGTPLESRWMGEVCKSAAGMPRKLANEIVKHLLSSYESSLKDAPDGYTYEHLYDVTMDQPRPQYLALYHEVKAELENLGLTFKA
jgi:methylamine--corrinoid protein Co-methyltransferase